MNLRGKTDDCPIGLAEAMELWLGPGEHSCFNSRAELLAAWRCARGYIMRMWGSSGRRPQAWWALGDAASLGLRWPGYFRERSYLYEHNVLSPQERDTLEREWRAAFDAARGMGVRERREHLAHNDVPDELIEAWTQERRRRRGRQRAPLEEVAAAK